MKKVIYRFYYDESVEEVIAYIRKETKTPNERVNYGDYYCKIKGNYIRIFKYNWWFRKTPRREFIGNIESCENGTVISGEFKISTQDKVALAVFTVLCLLISINGISASNSIWNTLVAIMVKLLVLMVIYAVIGLSYLLSKVIYKKEEQAVLELLGAKATKQEIDALPQKSS